MNRFFVFFLVFVTIAISVAGAYAYFIYIPEKVERIVISGINRFGFENPVFGSLRRENGQIILNDVTLDSERFNTIKELRIRYSALKFIINQRQAQDITISGLNLTGELTENFVPVVAGWVDNAKIVKSLQNFPAGKIYIESATLNLLSEKFGGIKILGEGQFLINGSEQVSLKARITTKQKKIGFISKLEASLAENNRIHFESNLEDISLDFPNVGIKRGHGTLQGDYYYDGKKGQLPVLTGNVRLASLRWYDLPLHDVKTDIEYKNEKRKYTLKGSTFGPEHIAWNADVLYSADPDDKNNSYRSVVHISPESLRHIQKFLGRNKSLGINAYFPYTLLNIASPSIKMENTYQPSKGYVEGSVAVKYEKPALLFEAAYHSDPTALTTDVIGNIRLDKTTYRPASEAINGTRFNLSALGNFKLKNFTGNPAFLWIAHTKIHNGLMDFGSVDIPNIGGVVLLGGSEAEQKKRVYKLNYAFPLKAGIEHEGTLFLNFNDTQTPLLDHLSLKIYGGEIKTLDPLTERERLLKKNTLDVSNINLESLTRDAELAGIYVSGELAGIIPLEVKDSSVHVTGGLLQSQDTGIIRLSKTMTEGLFPGYTPKNVVLREALENFHYEFFEIRLDGDLNDRVMMTLNARGKNPDTKSKNPVDVSLQIETQISLLFKALMSQQ